MRLSDKLKAERASLLDTLANLGKVADSDNRVFSPDEQKAWDDTKAKLAAIDANITSTVEREEFTRTSALPVRTAIDDQGHRHPILNRDMKLADRFPRTSVEPFSFARAIKGIVTGDWREAAFEQRAMGTGTLPGGGYTVPTELSAMWLDMVRSKSVSIEAGVGTIPMGTQTLRIAKIDGDVVPAFRPEHVAFPESDVVFGEIDLKAKTIGVIARASIELIADSPMASEMIVASLTQSMAVAIDQAMLSGDGVVDATHDNPLGILNWPGINAIAAVGAFANYDPWLDAINLIEVANLEPNAVIDHPDTANRLRHLKTGLAGDQTTLVPPPDYDDLTRLVTTGLAAGNSLVGQFDQAVYGMREGMTIETTRVGADALSKGEVLIRAYMRLDTAVLRPKAFTKITGLLYTAPAPLGTMTNGNSSNRDGNSNSRAK